MKYRDVEYEIVIWDWLWTLYSRQDNRLFYWVEEYFKKYGRESRNFLVSYAFAPEKRKALIERFGIEGYFEKIVIEKGDKEELFSKIIEKYSLDKTKILVIGDNVLHEGVAAKKLGLKYLPIAVWNEHLVTELGIRGK
ncbi:MAG TPA: HAD hydrolase-like protein [Candidatus Dojkabacteria bacterium]|nr:HAD hydrolase-like protein [Candidatus Dojkabacteria bacterium]